MRFVRCSRRGRAPPTATARVVSSPARAGLSSTYRQVASRCCVVADHPCREAALEEMAAPAVAAVEALGIGRVETVHGVREYVHRCLEDEVVVRVHEAPRVACSSRLPSGRLEEREEVEPIEVVDEERLALHAARGDVVDAFARKVLACDPRQCLRGVRRPAAATQGARGRIRTQSSTPRDSLSDCPWDWHLDVS